MLLFRSLTGFKMVPSSSALINYLWFYGNCYSKWWNSICYFLHRQYIQNTIMIFLSLIFQLKIWLFNLLTLINICLFQALHPSAVPHAITPMNQLFLFRSLIVSLSICSKHEPIASFTAVFCFLGRIYESWRENRQKMRLDWREKLIRNHEKGNERLVSFRDRNCYWKYGQLNLGR